MVIAFCVYYELNMNVLNMTIFNLYNSLAYISSGDNYPQPFTKYAKVALFKKVGLNLLELLYLKIMKLFLHATENIFVHSIEINCIV